MCNLISIIIPVYNVEKYLCECIDSVANQTYKNLEIILVDDGSTDDSGKICDEYALKDARIKVIHKENGGLSSARNAGLNVFSGSYLMFVDSDDYIDSDMVEYLYHYRVQQGITCCGMNIKLYNGLLIKRVAQKYCEWNCREAIKNYLKSEILVYSGKDKCSYNIGSSSNNKLYDKVIFTQLRYKVGVICEDIDLLFDILFACKKIIVLPEAKYTYRQREHSITNKAFSIKRLDYFEARKKQELEMIRKMPEYTSYASTLTVLAGISIISQIGMLSKKERKQYRCHIEELINEIRKRKNVYKYITNKERIKLYILLLNCNIYMPIVNLAKNIIKLYVKRRNKNEDRYPINAENYK